MSIIFFIFCLLLAFIVVFLISWTVTKRKNIIFGDVVIDVRNPEKDFIRFEYLKDPREMINHKQIIFNVKYLS